MLVQRPEAVVVWLAVLVAFTAAQLGLNEEPRLRKRPRHFLDLQIQRTREGMERHVDCNVDCQDGSRDPVCGTNGQTYDNICDLDRDICKKVKVQLKHVGECSLAEKCMDERAAKAEQVANGESTYVPTCLADGSYAPVQCHNFTLYCWCSRLDGKPIPHTIQKEQMPECSDRTVAPDPDPPQQGKWNNVGWLGDRAEQTLLSLSTATPAARPRPPQPGPKRCSGRTRRAFISKMGRQLLMEFKRQKNARGVPEDRLLRKAVKWKFGRLDRNGDRQLRRREYRGLRKTVRKYIKPKKCAKKFPRLCDTDGNNSLTEDEWMSCFTVTGRQEGRRQDCSNGSCGPSPSRDNISRPRPSCEHERRSTLEAERAGNNSIPILACQPNGRYEPVQCYKDLCFCVDEWSGNSLDGTVVKNGTPDCSRPMPHARDWPGCTGETKAKFIKDLKKYLLSKAEGGDRSAGAESSTQSVEEFAATYHFRNLDRNNNNYLEKKEKRLAKRFLKSNPKLKQCGRKITKYCDADRDNRVSLEEWVACVVFKQNDTGNSSRSGVGQDNIRRIEENPILKFLSSEEEVSRL
ncbi:SPARC-related modular calcium-binding protein 1-like isoform X2 [Panulirus ornatus]|uniref:SPARC-related modular calcium-binding protein 1-like isoform X2 n=1 Tax=Panulirus ornatus TaxID=150431 RepID=UPI003A84C977